MSINFNTNYDTNCMINPNLKNINIKYKCKL